MRFGPLISALIPALIPALSAFAVAPRPLTATGDAEGIGPIEPDVSLTWLLFGSSSWPHPTSTS